MTPLFCKYPAPLRQVQGRRPPDVHSKRQREIPIRSAPLGAELTKEVRSQSSSHLFPNTQTTMSTQLDIVHKLKEALETGNPEVATPFMADDFTHQALPAQ